MERVFLTDKVILKKKSKEHIEWDKAVVIEGGILLILNFT